MTGMKIKRETLKIRHKIVKWIAPKLWEDAHIPTFRPMIDFLVQNFHRKLVGVEIGVDEGVNTKNILTKLPIERLYLVDPYIPYNDGSGVVTAGKEVLARKRLSKFQSKIVFLIEKSEDVVSMIPDNLDFVYIDGNHSYEFVKKDIELYYPKVREGGVIGGHDFYKNFLGVLTAVIEFVRKENLKLYNKNVDWWVVKKEEK